MRRDDKGEDAGAVVSFEREATGWVQKQILTAPDAKPGDAFGQSIALTEKHLVIGAPRNDAVGQDSGAAYVFYREMAVWYFQAKLTAGDGASGDLFGISVAIDGDTILVGSDLNDEQAENAGAVYAFVFDGNQWQPQAKLVASDGGKTDIFGVRVSLSGDKALISARRDDVEGMGVDAGSAYIFERNKGVWRQNTKLVSPDGNADDRFGRGVALSDNTAIISAMNNDAMGADTGALYLYRNCPDGWHRTAKYTAPDAAPNDRYGWNVSLSNGLAVVSTPNHGGKGKESGAVYIQDLSPTLSEAKSPGTDKTSVQCLNQKQGYADTIK